MDNIKTVTNVKYDLTNTPNKKNTENSVLYVMSESLLITVIPLIIGFTFFYPDDPFLFQTGFPWCILAPLLIGLRYGFIIGFSSALLYVLFIFIAKHIGLFQIESFPSGMSVGLLLTGMLAGEFRDIWEKINYQLTVENTYKENRLKELTKGYLLLQVSHNLLEQKVLGSPISLRSVLMRLKESIPLSEIQRGSSLSGIADNLFALFGEYGGVQIASLYEVHKHTELVEIGNEPIGIMGSPKPVNNNNVLVRKSLKTGCAVVASKESELNDDVIAVVPLVNTNNEVLALLTINEMVFVDYNYRTIDLLTLIGGYLGDAVSTTSLVDGEISFTRENFDYHIKRSLIDIKRCDISISLLVFNIKTLDDFQYMYRIVRNNSRKLDQLWVPGRAEYVLTICLLMPLTGESGVGKYISRIENYYRLEKNKNFKDSGINVSTKLLTKDQSSGDLFEYILCFDRS
jgi:hypothetical protein